jgi:hypothetical protein
MSSEGDLRNDTFVSCIREQTGENLPKLESKELRDKILRKVKVNDGIMTNGEFVDLIGELYDKYINRLKSTGKKGKAKIITAGAWAKNLDPNSKKGRAWWIRHVGGNEDNLFIEHYVPVFDTSQGDEGKQGYFEDLKLCLTREVPKAMTASKKKSKSIRKKKSKFSKKRKTNRKKKSKFSKKRKTNRKKKN